MNSLLDQKVYGNIASYYISQILFKQDQYQKVVDFVIPILDNSVNSRKKELYRILAESYYRLESYKNADNFFEKYNLFYSANYIFFHHLNDHDLKKFFHLLESKFHKSSQGGLTYHFQKTP